MKGNTLYWKYNVVFCFIYILARSNWPPADYEEERARAVTKPWLNYLLRCLKMLTESSLCVRRNARLAWWLSRTALQHDISNAMNIQVSGITALWKWVYSSSLSVPSQRNFSAMETDVFIVRMFVKGTIALRKWTQSSSLSVQVKGKTELWKRTQSSSLSVR